MRLFLGLPLGSVHKASFQGSSPGKSACPHPARDASRRKQGAAGHVCTRVSACVRGHVRVCRCTWVCSVCVRECVHTCLPSRNFSCRGFRVHRVSDVRGLPRVCDTRWCASCPSCGAFGPRLCCTGAPLPTGRVMPPSPHSSPWSGCLTFLFAGQQREFTCPLSNRGKIYVNLPF